MMTTELIVLLDRSGSMETGREDHQGGLRSFVRDQRRLAGDVRLTLAMFDSHNPCEFVFDNVQLHTVEESKIELVPRGSTPLLDAVGRLVSSVSARHVRFKPDMTIMMIITDGQENDSKEWTKEKVKELLTRKEEDGWKVLYLGANVDEFYEAHSMGISGSVTLGYANTPQGINATYTTLSSGVACARQAFAAGASVAESTNAGLTWTSEQREWSKIGMPTQTDKEEE